MRCPICDRDNPGDARRCKACGADFEDPELAAQLDRPATAADDGEPNLQGDRYLGVRWIGLEVGGDLRKVALIGGIGFAIAAVLPLSLDLEKVRAVWSVLDDGPAFALLVPFLLAAIGIGLWFGEKLPPVVTAGVLAAGGLAVLGFAIAPQGKYALLMTRTWWAPWIGVAIAGAGVVIRVLRRRDPYARWIVVGGAAIVLIGMFLPYTDGRSALPGEFPMFMRDQDLLDKSIGGASYDGFDSDAMVRFLSLWHIALIGLCAAAAGFSIGMSRGPWDSAALVLRPLGWVLVFWVPATFALYTLNITGWKAESMGVDRELWDRFTTSLFAGRIRIAALAIPAAAWLAIGLAGLYVKLVVPRLPRPA